MPSGGGNPSGGADDQRLVARLQRKVDRLARLHLTGEPRHELETVLTELQEDIKDLERMAPHIWVAPVK